MSQFLRDRRALRDAGYVDVYAETALLWFYSGNDRAAWLNLMLAIMKELHA